MLLLLYLFYVNISRQAKIKEFSTILAKSAKKFVRRYVEGRLEGVEIPSDNQFDEARHGSTRETQSMFLTYVFYKYNK